MDYSQNIQWFPGHMAKARRKIQENLKFVDAMVEIADARIPESSRNPELGAIASSKPQILVLNKCDMADPQMTAKWINHYSSNGLKVIALDCKTGKNLNNFASLVKVALREKIATYKQKGFINKPLRLMVVGIPNVGKSAFINKLLKVHKTQVENRPGVTRNNQWFVVSKNLEILDTPGVLWPKFDDQEVGKKLAFCGSIKEAILDAETLACDLVETLVPHYAPALASRYQLSCDIFNKKAHEILEQIAINRAMFTNCGKTDIYRAAVMLLDEFQSGKLGKITLDFL